MDEITAQNMPVECFDLIAVTLYESALIEDEYVSLLDNKPNKRRK